MTTPPISVVIPYLDRKTNLARAVDHWLNTDYGTKVGVTVVDFSTEASELDVSRIRLIRSQARWNICRARNIGARFSYSSLLVFSTADMLVAPEFIRAISQTWDKHDMWTVEGLDRELPSDPCLKGLIAVKRWVNTRIRGFNEKMMESPHGWGYDADDYILRASSMLQQSGSSVGTYPITSVTLLPHTDEERVAVYDNKDLEATYAAHARYSQWYRQHAGYVANLGENWGQQYA